MEQLRWNQIEEVLQAALDVDPAERELFLRRTCGSDSDLRRRVDELLAGESAGMALEAPAIAALAPHLAGPPLTGRRISHYRIEERIGAGGMGEVYLAQDEALQRRVALKTLPEEFAGNAERVQRFAQEAFAASRLNHPNIITIFEVVDEQGAHWIATEHVEGKTLREVLKEESLGVARAVDIALQVAAALKAAHTAWIIHRDIKPENIMVRPDGVVKVLDFGIAKLSEGEDDSASSDSPSRAPHLTAVGAVLGTASYMSPEQARGEPLDGRTDIYSLGLVLREMLAGARAPKALTRIVERMLRPDRDARYASAAELLDDFGDVRRRLETTTVRRLMGMSAIAAAVAIVLTAFAAYLSVTERWEEQVLRDGHTAAARRAIFSPDGRRIVTTGEDGQVILWDFATRQRIATLEHAAEMLSCAPDGRSFATGGVDGTIAIWDAATLRRTRTLRHGTNPVTALAHSNAGRLLASSDRLTHVVWDLETGSRIRQWPDGVSYGTVVFSRDDNLLFSGSILLDDIRRNAQLETGRASANWHAVSPDHSRATLIDADGDVVFYRFENSDFTKPHQLLRVRAHQDHGRSVAYSPDGRLVATAAEEIVLWDAERLEKVARFTYESIVWSVTFSPDGRWLLSSHGDGAVLIWDVAERQSVASLNGHSGGVRAVAFHPDGTHLVSGGEDRAVIVWDLAKGRKERVLVGHTSRVTGVAFLAGSNRIASADHTSHALLWDARSRRPVANIDPTYGYTYALTASSDGRFLLSSDGLFTSDGRKRLDFSQKATWPYGQPYGVAFSRDGETAVAVTASGWAVRLRVADTRIVDQYEMKASRLITTSLSSDGRWMVTGEDQGAVRLWSVEPLRPVAILGRHRARVKSVAFAPDGKTVASAGDDKVIALWNVDRRTLRAHVGTHTSPIYAVAFSPDGRQLASGEHDRSVRIYTRRRTLWGYELE